MCYNNAAGDTAPLVGGKERCRERLTTSPKHWRCGTTRVCCTGWRSLTLDRSGFASPIFLLPKATLGKGNAVQEEKLRVSDVADLVLALQRRYIGLGG